MEEVCCAVSQSPGLSWSTSAATPAVDQGSYVCGRSEIWTLSVNG